MSQLFLLQLKNTGPFNSCRQRFRGLLVNQLKLKEK